MGQGGMIPPTLAKMESPPIVKVVGTTCLPSSGGIQWATYNFARQLGLDPSKAAVYTPEYGGTGHYSLFIDAIGPDGYILPQYADLIDAFLRSAK